MSRLLCFYCHIQARRRLFDCRHAETLLVHIKHDCAKAVDRCRLPTASHHPLPSHCPTGHQRCYCRLCLPCRSLLWKRSAQQRRSQKQRTHRTRGTVGQRLAARACDCGEGGAGESGDGNERGRGSGGDDVAYVRVCAGGGDERIDRASLSCPRRPRRRFHPPSLPHRPCRLLSSVPPSSDTPHTGISLHTRDISNPALPPSPSSLSPPCPARTSAQDTPRKTSSYSLAVFSHLLSMPVVRSRPAGAATTWTTCTGGRRRGVTAWQVEV